MDNGFVENRICLLLNDFKLFPAYIGESGTLFLIAIKEINWIEPVYFVTEGHSYPAEHMTRGLFPNDLAHYYSIFFYRHHYQMPCKRMEAHWYFHIGGVAYSTESMFFEVVAEQSAD